MIYTNGCSWTAGDELGEPEGENKDLAWPKYLGKLLEDEDVFNESGCGQSNDQICRETCELLQHTKPNFVVIGITSFYRMEVANCHQKMINFEDHHAWQARSSLLPDSGTPDLKTRFFNKPEMVRRNFYKYYIDDAWGIDNTCKNIIVMEQVLAQHNVPYLFFTAFGKTVFERSALRYSLFPSFLVNHNNYISNITFSNYFNEKNIAAMPKGHPSEKAHYEWAGYLATEIKKRELY